jgi:hypothetical protein
MGARLALHLHIPEIGINCIADCCLGRNLWLRLGTGYEAVADGAQFDGLAAGLVDSLVSGNGSAIAAPSPATDTPLDVVGAFGMDFNLAVDAARSLSRPLASGTTGAKRHPSAVLIFLMRFTRSA